MEMVMFEPWFQHTLKSIECSIPDLRDQFAMAALQGILPTPYGQSAENENVAASAYAIADAMMKARNRK